MNQKIAVICLSHYSGGMELDALKLTQAFTGHQISNILVCKKNTFIENQAISKKIKHESVDFSFKLSINLIRSLSEIFIKHHVGGVIFFGTSEIKSIYFSLLNKNIITVVRYGTTMGGSKKDLLHKFFYNCVKYHVGISQHIIKNIRDNIPISHSSECIKIYPHTTFTDNATTVLTPSIIHVGRLADGKGHIDLIRATRDINVPVSFLGSGETSIVNYIKNEATLCKNNDKYTFYGHKDNVSDYLRQNNIFVLPSYGEGLSNALIEALGYGLVCVVYDNTVFPEFVDMGFYLKLVKTGDIDELKRTLMAVSHNIDNELLKSRQNVRLARETFSVESEVTNFCRLFRYGVQ
jgi:glycosyltransferase involved in cell wall biosynthesis